MDREEKITIRTAAKALNITERSVQRYITKGQLTKVQEGHRVYVLADEIRQLRQQKTSKGREKFKKDETLDVVTMPGDKFRDLMSGYVSYKEQCNYLLEFKSRQERTEKELEEAKCQISEVNGWFGDVLQENKRIKEEKEKVFQEVQKVTDFNKALRTTNSLQVESEKDKDIEIEELRDNIKELRQELSRVKKRGLFKRIFNK